MNGIFNLIQSGANNNEAPEEFTFSLSGDLCQMSAQKNVLLNSGIAVGQNNVYPVIKEADKERSFQIIWDTKTDGWWHYEEYYIKFDICSKDEFRKELKLACSR